MSYTLPPGNAVSFSFAGPAYTLPAGDAVDFTFYEAPTELIATGALFTQYGAGAISINAYRQTNDTPVTKYGAAYTPIDRTVAASGSLFTRYGAPRGAFSLEPPTTVTPLGAASLRPTQYGVHAAKTRATHQAPAPSTQFGAGHVASPHHTAAGSLFIQQFGQASGGERLRATGTMPVRYGQPAATVPHLATGQLFPRCGTPSAATSGRRAASLMPTRLGRPRIAVGNAVQAEGLAATSYGGHQSANTYRSSSLPPTVLFGTAIVIRSPSC